MESWRRCSLVSQSSDPSYRRCDRGIPGVMPPSTLRNSSKLCSRTVLSLLDSRFICKPANCHKQKRLPFSEDAKPREPRRNYFQGFMWVLYISSPKGLVPTTSRRSPPKFTLRVVTITNARLLQRLVKQKSDWERWLRQLWQGAFPPPQCELRKKSIFIITIASTEKHSTKISRPTWN